MKANLSLTILKYIYLKNYLLNRLHFKYLIHYFDIGILTATEKVYLNHNIFVHICTKLNNKLLKYFYCS